MTPVEQALLGLICRRQALLMEKHLQLLELETCLERARSLETWEPAAAGAQRVARQLQKMHEQAEQRAQVLRRQLEALWARAQ